MRRAGRWRAASWDARARRVGLDVRPSDCRSPRRAAAGRVPKSASCSATQKLNWSDRASIASRRNCSGDMYAGVPMNAPVFVTCRSGPSVVFVGVASALLRRVVLREPRQAEVHHAYGAVLRDHHVLRLEVAVDDARRVRRRQSASGGEEDVQDLPASCAARRAQPLLDRLPVDQLHRDEHAVAERAGVVDGDDVRVREAGDGARLAEQPRATLAGAAVEPLHDLEGDAAVQLRVVSRVDLAHAAAPERRRESGSGRRARPAEAGPRTAGLRCRTSPSGWLGRRPPTSRGRRTHCSRRRAPRPLI